MLFWLDYSAHITQWKTVCIQCSQRACTIVSYPEYNESEIVWLVFIDRQYRLPSITTFELLLLQILTLRPGQSWRYMYMTTHDKTNHFVVFTVTSNAAVTQHFSVAYEENWE